MSAQVGVRTRARAALAMEPDSSAKPSLKRKKMSSSNSNQEQKFSKAPRKEANQQRVTTHLHQDRIKLLDLELQSSLVEMSTMFNCGKQIHRNEMNRSSKLHEDSQAPEPIEINSHRATSKERTMPTELELEEFFAAAEKDIQKRFQDKYNYDIVKDVPLEGRYEWVQLKP